MLKDDEDCGYLAEIRVNEANLSRAERIANLGYWDWDLTTNKVKWSDGHFRIFGYPVEHGTETFDMFRDRIHPDDIDVVEKALREGVTELKPYHIDYRVVLPDGSIRYVHAEAEQPLMDVAGKPVRWFGIVQDVTERKQAERLRGLAAIVESSDDAIIGKTLDGIITSWNAAAERMFGYSADEMIGKSKSVIIPADRAYELSFILNKIKMGDRIEHYETVRVRKDGKLIDVSISVSSVKDVFGRIIGASTISRDITERKRVEEALRESEARLAADLKAMTTLQRVSTRFVQAGDLDTLLNDIMHAAIDIAGADKGTMQLIRSGSKSLDIVAQHGFEQYYIDFFSTVSHGTAATCAKAFQRGERVIVEDVTKSPIFIGTPALDVQMKAGVRAVQSTPIVNRRGQMIGMFSTHWGRPHRPDEHVLRYIDLLARQVADIIERKRAEEALKEAKQQAELYNDLMGHDISNYNQAAMGFLELALMTLETEKRLKLDDMLLIERPLAALQSSSKLIENVRKLQQLMKDGVKTEPTDLGKVLKNIDVTSFNHNGREITINIPAVQHSMVEANELLRDVFQNLITNAVKHSDEEKPLTIDVKVEPVQRNGRMYYRCIVEDNGPGIPDVLKNKLFHRFQRGATKAHGKGLGLYLVRTLVEGFHGKVWVEDRVPGDYKKGSRFVVELPAA